MGEANNSSLRPGSVTSEREVLRVQHDRPRLVSKEKRGCLV